MKTQLKVLGEHDVPEHPDEQFRTRNNLRMETNFFISPELISMAERDLTYWDSFKRFVKTNKVPLSVGAAIVLLGIDGNLRHRGYNGLLIWPKHKSAAEAQDFCRLNLDDIIIPDEKIDVFDRYRLSSEDYSRLPSFIKRFSDKESDIIDQTVNLVKSKYRFNDFPVFIKGNGNNQFDDSQEGGRYFHDLGSNLEDSGDFINCFGKELYDMLSHHNVVRLKGLEYYECIDKPENGLWDSIYLVDKNPEILYKRTILHEVGHSIFESLRNPTLEKKISDIDIRGKVSSKGSINQHPAHPSFYSFYYAFGSNCDTAFISNVVDEHFAETFAFYMLGLISEDVKDASLVEKLKVVKDALRVYEK
jgi:hypothetical protein